MKIYHISIKNNYTFRNLTGLNRNEFEILAKQFGMYYKINSKKGRHHTLKESRYGLFFILFYFRHYCTQEFTAFIFRVDQAQVSRWIKTLSIPLHKCSQFHLKKHHYRKTVILTKNTVHFIVDATERQLQRPKINNQRLYSGKKKMHTIKNQILVDHKNFIADVSQTFLGKTHDIILFRHQNYPKHYKFIGDLGYVGESNIITPYKRYKSLNSDQIKFNQVISSIRCHVEHPFAWIKNYKILSTKFRGSRDLAITSFSILCGLYNFTHQLRHF